MTQPDLLPCPFCGGTAESDSQRAYRSLSGGRLGKAVAVYCLKCNADMTFCCKDARDIEPEHLMADMVHNWNSRARETDLVQALRSIAEARMPGEAQRIARAAITKHQSKQASAAEASAHA